MKRLIISALFAASTLLTAHAKEAVKSAESSEVKTTPVTDENYSLAETQVIIAGYVKKIAAATGTNGMGVWMNNKKGANPKDRDVMRKNFDTIYSWAVFDLSEPATIVLPENEGRYQTAWVISEEHHNPFAFVKPGEYTLTRENVGTPYAIVVVRTQANVLDPKDVAAANALQEKLSVKQKNKGSYKASHQWDRDEILKMRTKYQQIAKNEKVSPDLYFGKKGERTDKQHNCGTAMGWGGFRVEQAAYVDYYPTSDKAQTLTLKDVPAKAFWSITVYDKGGFVQTETYNINSQFAKKNADGSVTIHFGGDKTADNYMETFKDWTFILRLYQPKDNYLNKTWKRPELEWVK
jgi:hypothetical protein